MDCIAALQKNPDMHGIVFDRPAVVRTIREIILEYGLEDRMTVLAEDYITDPIGSRYDLIHYA